MAADAYLTPHLTRDHLVTQQVRPTRKDGGFELNDDLGNPLVARYRVLDRQTHSNGGDATWVGQALSTMTRDGCSEIFEHEGFVVLDCQPTD